MPAQPLKLDGLLIGFQNMWLKIFPFKNNSRLRCKWFLISMHILRGMSLRMTPPKPPQVNFDKMTLPAHKGVPLELFWGSWAAPLSHQNATRPRLNISILRKSFFHCNPYSLRSWKIVFRKASGSEHLSANVSHWLSWAFYDSSVRTDS